MRLALAIATGFALSGCAILLGIDKTYVEGDAGGEGAAAGEGGACLPAPDGGYVFCDDFDETPLGANWSSTQTKLGSAVIDTANPFSPPNAFLSSLPANTDGGAERYAKLLKSFVAARVVDCSFELQVRTQGQDQARFASIFVVNPDLPLYELNVIIVPGGTPYVEEIATSVDGGAYGSKTNVGALFPVGGWTRVELAIEYGHSIRLWVDGALAAQMSALPQTPQGEIFLLGAMTDPSHFATGTTTWEVLYDDVACSVTL